MANKEREARDERVEQTVSEFIKLSQGLLEMTAMVVYPQYERKFQQALENMVEALSNEHYSIDWKENGTDQSNSS